MHLTKLASITLIYNHIFNTLTVMHLLYNVAKKVITAKFYCSLYDFLNFIKKTK